MAPMTSNHKRGSGALRARREAAGLSQQRLAELAGCSIATIGLYEGGYSPARSTVLERVLAVLDDERPVSQPGAVTTPAGEGGGHDAGYSEP